MKHEAKLPVNNSPSPRSASARFWGLRRVASALAGYSQPSRCRVTEEWWQPLVAAAIVRRLGLRAEHLLPEVQTRDGSIVDLLYVFQRRMIAFELKVAEPGEVIAPLDARALRQLRHYREACDAVWLVTVATPRQLGLSPDLRITVQEPLERQSLPEGVGWMIFDRLSLDVTPVVPAPELQALPAARADLCDRVLARLGRVMTAAKECRAT